MFCIVTLANRNRLVGLFKVADKIIGKSQSKLDDLYNGPLGEPRSEFSARF